jgi:hypothetical protein
MATNRNFSEEYRGPSGWWSAVKAGAAWLLPSTVLAGMAARFLGIQRLDPAYTQAENFAALRDGLKANKSGAAAFYTVLVGIPLVAAVRSYFTATTARADHEAAVATVKDLTVENAKLKADSAYQSRFAEREHARRGEAGEHASIVGR